MDGAQNVSRMCMCIEFVIQVLKQRNAHVSFPVGTGVDENPEFQSVFSFVEYHGAWWCANHIVSGDETCKTVRFHRGWKKEIA